MSSGPHAIGFRVMRLTRNQLQPPAQLPFDLDTDFVSDEKAAEILASRTASHSKASTSSQAHISHPLQICNIEGLLELPTSFGPLHLGEAFHCYISVVNLSQVPIHQLFCKIELETKRAKSTLHDSTKLGPLSLPVGGRHDFIVKHEIKDIGQHSLNCIVAYTKQGEEQRTLSQHYNFTSENPLSVRTKWRIVQRNVILEACIENISKVPMILDYVRLDPNSPYISEELFVDTSKISDETDPLSDLSLLKIISPTGGAHNLLFKLRNSPNNLFIKPEQKVLGKLDIKWRNSLGEVGRLQTQPISMTGYIGKEATMEIEALSSSPKAEVIFEAVIKVHSQVERKIRELTIKCTPDENEDILLLGSVAYRIEELLANGTIECRLNFLPRKCGVLKLPKLDLLEFGSQIPLDSIEPTIIVS